MKTISILCLGLTIICTGCLKKGEYIEPHFFDYEPEELTDRIKISYPAEENIDTQALVSIYRAAYSDEAYWPMRSLLVFRNGNLVAESYPRDDDDRDRPQLIWSCTKQVMAILTGIAIKQGYLKSVNDSIGSYLPQATAYPDKAAITIEQLLTMRAGFDYENAGAGGDTDKLLRQLPDNSIEFILEQPMINEPGEIYDYNDGAPHLLSAIIQEQVHQPTDVWATQVLFEPLSMQWDIEWERYKDGYTLGAFGIKTTPRELSKFGLLVEQLGFYDGFQIVDSSWIQRITTPLVETDDVGYMGYYWWIDTAKTPIYFMSGQGGQFVFVVPAENLVVTITAMPYTQGEYQIGTQAALNLVYRIIDACN